MIENNFFLETKSLRALCDDDGDAIAFYVNIRFSINPKGLSILANYYNKKYFKSKSMINVFLSLDELTVTITSWLQADKLVRGFILPKALINMPSNYNIYEKEKYLKAEEFKHVTPFIFEKNENILTILVSESAGFHDCKTVDYLIKLFSFIAPDYFFNIFFNPCGRQVDIVNCQSDAILFLKNSLQNNEPIQSVKLIDLSKVFSMTHALKLFINQGIEIYEKLFSFLKDNGKNYLNQYGIYMENPDMLKTTQITSSIFINRIDTNARLKSSKSKKTFEEKQIAYKKNVTYDLFSVFDETDKSILKTQVDFLERDYLRQKNAKHIDIIRQSCK